MKKAQIEMIGLVIIVIIILFTLMFYFRLNLNADTEPREKIGYEQVFASNLINVILNYKPGCEEKKIVDFLRECRSYDLSILDDSAPFTCGEPCTVKNEIKNKVTKIMSESGFENYYFKVERADENFIDEDVNNCKSDLGVTSPPYIVGEYEFNLKICK